MTFQDKYMEEVFPQPDPKQNDPVAVDTNTDVTLLTLPENTHDDALPLVLHPSPFPSFLTPPAPPSSFLLSFDLLLFVSILLNI